MSFLEKNGGEYVGSTAAFPASRRLDTRTVMAMMTSAKAAMATTIAHREGDSGDHTG
jgi:hypothetical protein